MASSPDQAPPVSPPPPPESPPPPPVAVPPESPPPPPVVPPPEFPPPPPIAPPPESPPPPPVAPPPESPPPPPVATPPESPPPPITEPFESPPPLPPVAVSPESPPPPPVAVPPTESPPPPPDVPAPTESPPPPDVPAPTESPPPPGVDPPTVSPPPPPEAEPPTDSPPPPPIDDFPPLITTPSPPSPPRPTSPPVLPLTPPTPSGLTPPSPVLPKSDKSNVTPIAVGAVVGSAALLLALFALFWFLCFRKKRKRNPHGIESNSYGPGDGVYAQSAQSGLKAYPPSGEQLKPNGSPSARAAALSMSKSGGISSGYIPSSSTDESGGWGPQSSGTDGSLAQGFSVSGTIAFTYDELKIATNGFSSVNLLGQGGFGYVHKGMLQSGKLVAVKSLKADSGQGEREFQAEVETISRVHHKHLVTLVGYCITDSQKLLVYEFVQNKTMEFHLHGKEQPVMNWSTRLKIAVGAAKGLAYLHEDCHPKIIHRDIKAANILLDHTFEAQVADFGLAKFSSDTNTHISTRVMGTFGYLAPEYASSGQLSEKSDIFSFGVLLLELVTGRRPVDFTTPGHMEDSLVDWARPLFSKALQDGDFDILVDPRLGKDYIPEEMGAMITCAASCVRHSAKRRPKMSQIVRALEGNLALSDLTDGVKPGFSSLYSARDIDSSANPGDTLRFRKVFGSDETVSNESIGAREYSGAG